MDQKRIGAFIRERRRAAGLTQEQLADRLGVSAKAVSKWERSICLPDASLYQPLCRQLGVTVGRLFSGGEDDRPEDARDWLIDLLAGRLYPEGCGLSFEAFRLSLLRMAEAAMLMAGFPDRSGAVACLHRETGLPEEECAAAYDFYLALNAKRQTLAGPKEEGS